jgi:hypothetical protein
MGANMANDESKKFGAQGGKKRAANMSKAERKEQAQKAALARWGGELPVAQFGSPDRPLLLGGLSLQCYVLSDGRRVLVQRGLQAGIGMSTSGGSGGAHRMARFIESLEAKGLRTNNLSVRMLNPILFRIPRVPKTAYGFEASIVPEIFNAIVDADKLGLLASNQKKYAEQGELFVRALANRAITKMVDEVTGFQETSDQEDIARFLREYVKTELRMWVSTFPRSFFEQLCRLKGVPFPKENMRLPQYFGGIVNELIYTRLAPGVLPELKAVNPVIGPKGHRRGKHHSFLTEQLGHPKLLNLVGKIEGIAYGFADGEYDAFKLAVDTRIPNYGSLPLFAASEIPQRIASANAKLLRSSSSEPPQSS